MPLQVWRLPLTPFTTLPLTNADYNYIGLDSFALLPMIDTDTL